MTTTAEEQAYALGCEHARNAASWTVDGASREYCARLLAMLDAGDPAVRDFLPREPDLSGEWADDLTPFALAQEVGAEASEIDVVADAYMLGVSETFEDACVAELLRVVEDQS